MGYGVHITRKADWFDEEGPEISLPEWLACVDHDATMRHDGFAEVQLPDGSVLRTESEGLSVWIGYSGHGRGGNMAWFSYSGGNVTVKNPDEEILAKMIVLAETLGAKVQGDEGEIYPVADPRLAAKATAKPWWRFW